MSEYKYYEFRAIDRTLTAQEMKELRELSTRAEITPRSFTNEYAYGSFRGDPESMMEKYFDLFVYVANYGTRRLMIRVPATLLPQKVVKPYCAETGLRAWKAGGNLVVSFEWADEPTGWEDGGSYTAGLVGLRDELMCGDLRSLYLGWLAAVGSDRWYGDEDSAGDREPPVPPGLSKLSAAQKALADFLMIDEYLIAAAAEADPGRPPADATDEQLADWVKGLPAKDKDDYLIRLVSKNGAPSLAAKMLRRFRESNRPEPNASKKASRRKLADLLARRDVLEENARQAEARAETKKQAKQKSGREAHLDTLAGREGQVWADVEAKIQLKTQDAYDEAVALLTDLRDLALRQGRRADFDTRLHDLRHRHRYKTSLFDRINKAFPAS
ncbi:MAG: hypothetical protein U0835_14745 [Isosphaeraceae bacterium]